MTRTRITCIIRRIAYAAAGLAGALLGVLITSSAAFAYQVPAPGGPAGPPPPPVASGGMPGWQITLIAVGAALLGSVLAVLADRSRAGRRQHSATNA